MVTREDQLSLRDIYTDLQQAFDVIEDMRGQTNVVSLDGAMAIRSAREAITFAKAIVGREIMSMARDQR